VFITSALGEGEWSASRPDRFTAGVRAPGNYCIRGWVGLRFCVDAVTKEKIPSLSLPGIKHRSSSL